RLRNAIREPQYQTALALAPLGCGTCKCKQLLARLNPAAGIIRAFAVTGAQIRLGIILVDRDNLIDAISEPVRDSVFEGAWPFRGSSLDDEVCSLEGMHRERTDVFHAATDVGVLRAVPFVSGLLWFFGGAIM